jgi:1-acyl-sn-glycerol-3-phosphate acyltransferase
VRDLLQTVFYWLNVHTWVRLIVTLVTRREVKGLERVPRRGALILASNHFNLADPPILTFLTPRRIVWMAKQELFDIPVAGLLYRVFGCIPVRRFEADLRALRKSQEALRREHVLGMFPEGTRSDGRGLQRAEAGTALLALRSGTPVLPVAIWGTEGIRLPRDFFRCTHVHVVFGEPFRLPRGERLSKERVQQAADEIMRHIAELLPPEYRGVYARVATEVVATARKRAN